MTDKTKLTLIRVMCKTYYECYADNEVDLDTLNLLIDLICNVAAFQEKENG